MEKKEAAEFMNNYFITVGEELNQSNNTNWTQHSYFQSLPKDNFFLNVVCEDIVYKYVKTLDIAKPSGITKLNNKLLIDAFKILIGELSALFNESIIQETFPEDWKMGIVTPIPKSGNLMLKTNWGAFLTLLRVWYRSPNWHLRADCGPGVPISTLFQLLTECPKVRSTISYIKLFLTQLRM